nr:hypothetical protein [uncultured Parolsenella sp.]
MGSIARKAVTAGLVALCCVAAMPAQTAHAATVEELQEHVDQANEAYDEATAQVTDLQAKIADSQAKIDDVNAQLPQQKERAEESVRSMYKMQQGTPGLVTLLLTSDDFQDFISTYQYLNSVSSANTDDLQRLNQMERELTQAQQTLVAAQDEATKKQQEAADSLSQAQSALDELNRQIEEQKAAEAAAAAQAQAEAAAAQQAQADAQTAQSQQAQSQEAQTNSSGSSQASNASSSSSSESSDGVKDDGEWMIGSASAYSPSGSSSITASGEPLTMDSMTVAVPISQRYLLGRSVQIRWNGKTVTARVTDVGGFAGYGRALDLAPGVWKAFGFSSTGSWGVRTVQYRFL